MNSVNPSHKICKCSNLQKPDDESTTGTNDAVASTNSGDDAGSSEASCRPTELHLHHHLRRKMALDQVRESTKRLKATFLEQVDLKLSAVLDDMVLTFQKADTLERYNGFGSSSTAVTASLSPQVSSSSSHHHPLTPFSASTPAFTSTTKRSSSSSSFSSRSRPSKLPEKVFVSRPSPLTELFQVTHFKTIHHIFIATLILIMLHNIILDLVERNTVDLGLMRLMWAFGRPQLTLSILLALEFCGLVVVYPAFHFWSRVRTRVKSEWTRAIDYSAALSFLLFLSGMMVVPAQIMWNNPLPPASGATVTMEQCRLLMKIYAFVRSNVPRVLSSSSATFPAQENNGNRKQKKVGDNLGASSSSASSCGGNNEGNQEEEETLEGKIEEAERLVLQQQGTCTDFSVLKRRKQQQQPSEEQSKTDVDGDFGGNQGKSRSQCGDNDVKGSEYPCCRPGTCPSYSKYLYFYVAPTLIYKDHYPRTSFVRWDYVCWNFAQVLGCIVYANFILSRYSTFYFAHFGHPQHPMTVLQFCNAVFSMMLPGILGLVLGFYLLLHSWHNAFAEMLCFGDRLFYKDWWNCSSFHSYYKTWNILVHDWLYTYIFKDAWEFGLARYHKAIPTVLVFVISSLFHEYVLSFAFNFFFPVLLTLFGGFGLALTFVRNSDSVIGNIFMWFGLISGSGILVSTYTMEFYARINCPVGHEDAMTDFFTPRFWTCNALVWK